MPVFGTKSKKFLSELHPDLQKVLNHAIKTVDFSLICGTRGKEEQERAFREKKSKAHYGQSPHNFSPSFAVDMIPYPFQGWDNLASFNDLGAAIMKAADEVGIELTWGKSFSFRDYPHFELKDWRERAKKG